MPLAPLQMLEVLKFQNRESYNREWLRVEPRPHFRMFNGHKHYRHYLQYVVASHDDEAR